MPSNPVADSAQMEQLKNLLTYTTFHIGMYTSLCTLLLAIVGWTGFKKVQWKLAPYLFASLLCFAIAGIFGGLVGSSIPYFKSFEEFSNAKLGPWSLAIIPALCCTHIEHTAFWVGIVVAIFGLHKARRP